ncbi:MAG: Obg family GTPase CgtA [Nitrospinae bacterium]|nr:Obg family GTPase CgtA [Nitrospinota bacterium]
MLLDPAPIEKLFQSLEKSLSAARSNLGRKLTIMEKILFSHMDPDTDFSKLEPGKSDIFLNADRVAMQDATAQMAILQFMSAKISKVAVPTTIHCDHLIQAHTGSDVDLKAAIKTNKEVYDFLQSSAMKYGMGFWKPGSGIIHQVVFENYAVPGTLMIGTDSHTPNSGGLGMIAIGVGGADAVDIMTGQQFMTRMPKLVGIKLTGKLNGWTASKDIILKVATMLTVKGGTGKILEYFGDGARSLSATSKGTVTNMGAEIGSTTSIFGYDENMDVYLRKTERDAVADLCKKYAEHLVSDPEVEQDPEKYYDEIHEIDLSTLEPQIVGPHTPDLGRPVSQMAADVDKNNYPEKLSAALIGSCTNSSYEDLTRAVSLARQAKKAGLKAKSIFLVTPGSERIFETISRDGILKDFEDVGGTVLANACGPCIGQWKREDIKKGDANSIISSYNRNFAKRNDGNAETLSFITSPEIVVAMAFAGSMKFNPMTDSIGDFKFEPPTGEVYPAQGYASKDNGYMAPSMSGEVVIDPKSERLSFLEPFPKQDPVADFKMINEELRQFNPALADKPQIVVVNKLDVTEVREKQAALEAGLREAWGAAVSPSTRILPESSGAAEDECPIFFISAVSGEGVTELLGKIVEVLGNVPVAEPDDLQEAPVPVSQRRARTASSVSVEKGVYVVQSEELERLVTMSDTRDRRVLLQLWREMGRLGVAVQLEEAGVEAGDTIRIGDAEVEWF